MNKIAIIIPSRLDAQRLPNKPLKIINNKEMILHVYDVAIKSNAGEVYVATPDQQIVDIVKYEKENKEINTSIRNLLKIDESIKRKNRIQNILKTKIQYKPYISDGLDMIFSIGTSKNMKKIKPQFNFNYAEDVPFYSTSHIYNGITDKKTNQDLNNIKFCDIPWLYNSKNFKIKKILNENSEKKDLLRFFAIGMDSVKILYNINQLKNNKNKFLLGDTGYLQLDEFNKIRRNLVIVKFKNGIAKNIPF